MHHWAKFGTGIPKQGLTVCSLKKYLPVLENRLFSFGKPSSDDVTSPPVSCHIPRLRARLSWLTRYLSKDQLPGIVGSPHVDEPHQELEDLLFEDVGDELLVLAEWCQETKNEDLGQRNNRLSSFHLSIEIKEKSTTLNFHSFGQRLPDT